MACGVGGLPPGHFMIGAAQLEGVPGHPGGLRVLMGATPAAYKRHSCMLDVQAVGFYRPRGVGSDLKGLRTTCFEPSGSGWYKPSMSMQMRTIFL